MALKSTRGLEGSVKAVESETGTQAEQHVILQLGHRLAGAGVMGRLSWAWQSCHPVSCVPWILWQQHWKHFQSKSCMILPAFLAAVFIMHFMELSLINSCSGILIQSTVGSQYPQRINSGNPSILIRKSGNAQIPSVKW